MNGIAKISGIAVLLACLTSCAHRAGHALERTLNVAVWRTADRQGKTHQNFVPPETRRLPELQERENLGIAISGGGSRSAVAALGQFRGLREIGLLGRARYISAVSGGAWFATPYVFARSESSPHGQSQEERDRTFFGPARAPSDLCVTDLTQAEPGSFVEAVSRIDMGLTCGLHVFRGFGDETYAEELNNAVLRPFGLGDDARFFTWSRDWFRSHIGPHNPSLSPEQFYFAAPDRPYLIVGQALMRESRLTTMDKLLLLERRDALPFLPDRDTKGFWMVESTPLYTGVRPVSRPWEKGARLRGLFEHPVGGGLVESFGADARFVKWQGAKDSVTDRAFVSLVGRSANHASPSYGLADMLAASSAAPAGFLGRWMAIFGHCPKMTQWPAFAAQPQRHNVEYPMADGGACDNTAIIPLLARRVGKIVALLNFVPPFPPRPGSKPNRHDLPAMVNCLFGERGEDQWRDVIGQAVSNRVLESMLPDGTRATDDIARALAADNEAGRPLVHCQDYVTVENDRYGVPGGHHVTICWVYLVPASLSKINSKNPSRPTGTQLDSWINQLSDHMAPGADHSVRDMFIQRNLIRRYGLRQFPEFDVVMANPGRFLQLSVVQSQALAHYSAFCIMEAAQEIRRGPAR